MRLTERETAILCLIAAGYTSDQAADILHLSYHTVAQHIAAMLRKSGARNRGELIARSFVAGILDAARWPPSVCQEDGVDKRVLETRVAIPGEPLPPMTSFSAG